MAMSLESVPEYAEGSREVTGVQKVSELPEDDQPRVRALRYGISSLSTADLFAIILRTGVKGYPITSMCRDLMKLADNNLLLLERKSHEELRQLKGMGELKTMQVEAVMEIVRRYSRETMGEKIQISDPSVVYRLMRPEIGNLPYEEIWVLLLDRRNRVMGKLRVSEGGSTSSVFDIKKIVRAALLSRAEAVVLSHNHPSGNLRPSASDDAITKKLKEGCKALDLSLLDHVIVTSSGYYSYRDSSDILP